VIRELINQNLPIAQRPDKITHNHIEAFCLMVYEHEDCGHEEVIYNTRDGVTPFLVPCPNCCAKYYDCNDASVAIGPKELMRHKIALMNYQPDFKPPEGMLIFKDESIGILKNQDVSITRNYRSG